jgi:hypothetical protein
MKGTTGGVSNVSLPSHPDARRPHPITASLHRRPSRRYLGDFPECGPVAPFGTRSPVLDSHRQRREHRWSSDSPSTTQEVKGGE